MVVKSPTYSFVLFLSVQTLFVFHLIKFKSTTQSLLFSCCFCYCRFWPSRSRLVVSGPAYSKYVHYMHTWVCQKNFNESWILKVFLKGNRGHLITTWIRWGGEGVKKCLFLSTMAKFCPRSCWMPPYQILTFIPFSSCEQLILQNTNFCLFTFWVFLSDKIVDY